MIYVYDALAVDFAKLPDSNPTIIVGSSSYDEMQWDLSDLMVNKTGSKSSSVIDFSPIPIHMISVIKKYIYYRLGTVSISSVTSNEIYSMVNITKYLNSKGLDFEDVTDEVFTEYADYLKSLNYSNSAGYTLSYALENLLRIGNRYKWFNSPINLVRVNARKLWNKAAPPSRPTEAIPDDVLDQIINAALHKETNIPLKAGILIQSQTGIRINEVLSLQTGCLKKDDYGSFIWVKITKTENGDYDEYKVYLTDVAINAIEELEKYSKEYRKESGLKELFLSKHNYKGENKVRTITPRNFAGKLKTFAERWNITDENGEIYYFHSHQFRATFAKKALENGHSLELIRQQFHHASLDMTLRYLNIDEEMVQKEYISAVFSPDSKVVGINADTINEANKEMFRGKTASDIEEIQKTLSKQIVLHPLPNGACAHNVFQEPCTNGSQCFFFNCPNFITTSRWYPELKAEQKLLYKEIKRYEEKGMVREIERAKEKLKYLDPIIEKLESEEDVSEES